MIQILLQDNSIGGMSGKVNGQRIFDCKPKHGLLIPVEYVSFLNNNYGDSTGVEIPPDSTYSLHRTRSVPALSRSLSVRDFEPESVPGLRIGDTVVWLGGIRPMTGVVKWVGRDGRSKNIPLKAWVEMVSSSIGKKLRLLCLKVFCLKYFKCMLT